MAHTAGNGLLTAVKAKAHHRFNALELSAYLACIILQMLGQIAWHIGYCISPWNRQCAAVESKSSWMAKHPQTIPNWWKFAAIQLGIFRDFQVLRRNTRARWHHEAWWPPWLSRCGWGLARWTDPRWTSTENQWWMCCSPLIDRTKGNQQMDQWLK